VEQGYEGTSVAAIVRRAGVAQGTFYLYFDGKARILTHLQGRVLVDMMQAFQRAKGRPGPADERLVAGVKAILQVTTRHRDLLRVFRQGTTGEETELVWIQGREAFSVPFARLLRDGVDEGRFTVDDPELAAYLGLTLFDDLLYEAVTFKKPAGPKKTMQVALRFLLRALGTPEPRIAALVPPG
jgi:AcrR family transcriptional regulator